MEMVLVEWWDASGETVGWTDLEDLDDSKELVLSCGFLAKEGSNHIHVALSYDEDAGTFDQAIKIPHAMVIKVTKLTPS
jgi:hypothetical protein